MHALACREGLSLAEFSPFSTPTLTTPGELLRSSIRLTLRDKLTLKPWASGRLSVHRYYR